MGQYSDVQVTGLRQFQNTIYAGTEEVYSSQNPILPALLKSTATALYLEVVSLFVRLGAAEK